MLSNHEKDTKIKRRDAFFLCGLIFKKKGCVFSCNSWFTIFQQRSKQTHTHTQTNEILEHIRWLIVLPFGQLSN